MHNEQIQLRQHTHIFTNNKKQIEKKTLIVVLVTFSMMVAEILSGLITNSMALLADGFHMGTHAFALGISLLAYILARKHAKNSNFTFGTWKIEILGAYTSALLLGVVSLGMIVTSVERFIKPLPIHYNNAIAIAVLGLFVNVICAMILISGTSISHHHDHHNHSHHHHDHDHDHDHYDDLNFRAAYLHVLADALTSVFAIAALFGAKYLGLNWLDPFMGITGAVLIIRWSIYLLKNSGSVLLDYDNNAALSQEIKELIESDGSTRISDLHLWKVAEGSYGCIISIVSSANKSVDYYKDILKKVHELSHITLEINEFAGTQTVP